MDRNGARRGAANLAIPLMIVAFLTMVGFMWWLYKAAAPEVEVVEVEAPVEDPGASVAATDVDPTTLQQGAAAYAGQTVRLRDMAVLSQLGPRGFWVELPNRNPFLIRAPAADSTAVASGQTVTVVGQMVSMNDSILTDWVTTGAITEDQRLEAEFATEFIEAQFVAPGAAAPAAPAGQG
jgi:hypothetical protein